MAKTLEGLLQAHAQIQSELFDVTARIEQLEAEQRQYRQDLSRSRTRWMWIADADIIPELSDHIIDLSAHHLDPTRIYLEFTDPVPEHPALHPSAYTLAEVREMELNRRRQVWKHLQDGLQNPTGFRLQNSVEFRCQMCFQSHPEMFMDEGWIICCPHSGDTCAQALLHICESIGAPYPHSIKCDHRCRYLNV